MDGVKQKSPAAELRVIAAQTGEMVSIMKAFGQAKESRVVALDIVDGATTIVGAACAAA